jgi:hypothetical protein
MAMCSSPMQPAAARRRSKEGKRRAEEVKQELAGPAGRGSYRPELCIVSRLQSPLAVVLRSDGAHFSSSLCSLGGFRLNASPGHPEVRDGRGVSSKPDHGRNGQGAGSNIGDSRADGVCGAPEESAALPRVSPICFQGAGGKFGTSPFRDPRPAALEPRTAKPIKNARRRAGSEIKINGTSTFAGSRNTSPASRRTLDGLQGPLNLGVSFRSAMF